jgi:hypothetical protein
MLGLLAVISITAIYHLIFFNRVFPIQEGWFSCLAHEILLGRIPYKDFHLFLQPVYPFEIAGLTFLFGDSFIIFRIVGLVERLFLVAVLFLMLKRIVPVHHAIAVTLASLAVYASHTTDVICSYYQTCLSLGLLSAYLLLRYVEDPDNRHGLVVTGISGVLAGGSFMTKQSTGLFITAALGAVLLISSFRLRRPTNRFSPAAYVAGWLCPVIACFSWLASTGAFRAYIEQVYRGASSSKGSLWATLFAFWTRALDPMYLAGLLIMSLITCLSWIRFKNRNQSPIDEQNSQMDRARSLGLVVVGSSLAFFLPLLYRPVFGNIYPILPFYVVKLCVVHLSFYISILASIFFFIRVWVIRDQDLNLRLFLLSIVSLSIMYAHGLSFTLEEHAIIPSLGLMCAALLFLIRGSMRVKTLSLYACCFALIFFSAVQKYVWPYQWWGWRESSIFDATEKSALSPLKGFRISPVANTLLTEITALIERYSSKNDHIFTYPHIPVFYVLSGRYPSTFALIHYFDVCPDQCAIRDAAELLRKPPAVIVNLEFPEEVWKFHENAFRKGALSGQRKIAAAIGKLTRTGQYKAVGKFETPLGYPISVWAKTPTG